MNFDLKHYVYRIDNFLDHDFCRSLIKKIKKYDYSVNTDKKTWHKHSYYDNITEKNISHDNDLSVCYDDSQETKYIHDKLNQAVADYPKHVGVRDWCGPVKELSHLRYNGYGVNTEMRLHVDHIHSLFDGQRKGVPVLTCLGTLNDNYEGGEFLMFNGMQYPMPTGTLLIFPSNFLYPHAVKPVKRGIRYSYVSWGW